ncbi:hypothetical protein GF322_03335 [Candidatus Dependentiae bacterium]|nr:hypothetical protein [Candidatus Dependentiae bacterium]
MFNQSEIDKNWFLQCLKNNDLIKKIKNIKLIICDIDGALTDAQIYLSPDFLCKAFSVQDGFIIDRSLKKNILDFAFLSGRNDEVTKIRAKQLGIPEDMCYIGFCVSKIEKVKEIQKKKKLSSIETLHFGDDFLDFEVKSNINLFVCPSNTPFYLQEKADLIVPRSGGNSPLRLLLDLILYVQEKHPFGQNMIAESLKRNLLNE